MTYRWLRDLHTVARSANLRVTEIPGWETRGRPEHEPGEPDRVFDPRGMVCHHTGGSGEGIDTARWLANVGRPAEGIPPPLAQLALSRAGVVYVLAAGRANHAGEVVALGGWLRAGDGNAQTIGIEAMNTGAEGWRDEQYDAYVRLCAALAERYAWPIERVVAHREVAPDRKVDPGKIDMTTFRRDVARLIVLGEEPMPEETPVWQRKLDVVTPGEGEPDELTAGAMLAQTHNRADDARDAAGDAGATADLARQRALEAREAAQEARELVRPLGGQIHAIATTAVQGRDAARQARATAERVERMLTEGSWGFEPASDEDVRTFEGRRAVVADGPPVYGAPVRGAALLESPEPDPSGNVVRKPKRKRGKSMRPREYRKATRAAVVPSAIGVVFLLWQNGWDVSQLTEQQVSGLMAAAAAAFAVVFGTGNADPEDD